MKIIAGKLKGRVIEMPKGIRPTSDKVREALFEILKDRIEGAAFLDLYCGSGAIGIEAFSRGAKSISFVENDARCIAILKKNISLLQLSKINIYARDALRWIKENKEAFDIVFLDPPYYKDMAKKTLIALSDCDILARNALVIIEAYKKDILPEEAGTLKKIRTCKYGDTKLEFYKT
ncbi:MAG: 16S rRNA (guanine(966)-N(2))-methyltransferase RsmD [Candidatus Gorgyraea atricola]|nr:16S rRNA (guanine(966)-N(2))-methyltransferase RsmD [Candidatus Gorgyraea atricola]